MGRFLAFVRSPYFNENQTLVRLAEALVDLGLSAEKDVVWSVICPGREFDDLCLRRWASELLALAATFMVQEQATKHPGTQGVQLLDALREREAHNLYSFYHRKQQPDPEEPESQIDSQSLLHAYLLEAGHNAWLAEQANRSGITNLDAAVANLDRFYLFNKLKYACTLLNNRNIVGPAAHDPFIEGLIRELTAQRFEDDPAIALYFRIYQMLSRPDEGGHYLQLRAMLTQYAQAFTREEARHLYAFALNYCIGRINAGEGTFLREIFGLYQEALERNVLLERDRLSPWDYKNIVVVGLRLSEFGWVESFIHGYRNRIPADHRDNAFTYNLAKLHFYKRQYSEVLRLLQVLEYEDVFYNLDAKTMLLKIYFELHEIEALDSLIESFRTFLRRNKLISDSHRTNYLNLILFVKKLSRVRYGDHKRLLKIRADFEATRQIADADWLREKMGE
ncbi:MAG: hypothetical protein U0176_15080 [Bacteroidia bacterium]